MAGNPDGMAFLKISNPLWLVIKHPRIIAGFDRQSQLLGVGGHEQVLAITAERQIIIGAVAAPLSLEAHLFGNGGRTFFHLETWHIFQKRLMVRGGNKNSLGVSTGP